MALPKKSSRRGYEASADLKKHIKLRDGAQCWLCGEPDRLTVAHILEINDKYMGLKMIESGQVNIPSITNAENFFTLCRNCHGAYDDYHQDIFTYPEDIKFFAIYEEENYQERCDVWIKDGTRVSRTVPSWAAFNSPVRVSAKLNLFKRIVPPDQDGNPKSGPCSLAIAASPLKACAFSPSGMLYRFSKSVLYVRGVPAKDKVALLMLFASYTKEPWVEDISRESSASPSKNDDDQPGDEPGNDEPDNKSDNKDFDHDNLGDQPGDPTGSQGRSGRSEKEKEETRGGANDVRSGSRRTRSNRRGKNKRYCYEDENVNDESKLFEEGARGENHVAASAEKVKDRRTSIKREMTMDAQSMLENIDSYSEDYEQKIKEHDGRGWLYGPYRTSNDRVRSATVAKGIIV